MSARTELAQLRLREMDLLAILCGRCGHRLSAHAMLDRPCRGHFGEPKMCSCEGFVEPDEQLEIGGASSGTQT